AEDGIRVFRVTGVQTCALPIFSRSMTSLNPLRPPQAMSFPAMLALPRDPRKIRPPRPALNETVRDETASAFPPRVSITSLTQSKIGRASCRERGQGGVGAGRVG